MLKPEGKKGSTTEIVRQIVGPAARELGLDLWDVRYEKEGSAWYLRIFIDKPGGVTIADCEALSRCVDGPIDEADPIAGSYFLEVSSPGIERNLARPEHFAAYVGHTVSVRLIRPTEGGVRDFTGTLVGLFDDDVVINSPDGQRLSFAKKQTAFVRLHED